MVVFINIYKHFCDVGVYASAIGIFHTGILQHPIIDPRLQGTPFGSLKSGVVGKGVLQNLHKRLPHYSNVTVRDFNLAHPHQVLIQLAEISISTPSTFV